MAATTSTGPISFPLTHSEHFFVDVALHGDFDMCVDSQEVFCYFLWSFTVSDWDFVVPDLVTVVFLLDWLSYVFPSHWSLVADTLFEHSLVYAVNLIITQNHWELWLGTYA